jgi:hypothetical protein
LAFALAAVLAVSASAADISGKWVAQIPGRDGQTTEQSFMFKVSGETLTGTITTQRGEQQISEGKVTGEDVTFVVTREGRDGTPSKEIYKGKIAGNEIKFTRTREGGGAGRGGAAAGGGAAGGRGGASEFVAKRAS